MEIQHQTAEHLRVWMWPIVLFPTSLKPVAVHDEKQSHYGMIQEAYHGVLLAVWFQPKVSRFVILANVMELGVGNTLHNDLAACTLPIHVGTLWLPTA